jgi:hypothetical protein
VVFLFLYLRWAYLVCPLRVATLCLMFLTRHVRFLVRCRLFFLSAPLRWCCCCLVASFPLGMGLGLVDARCSLAADAAIDDSIELPRQSGSSGTEMWM